MVPGFSIFGFVVHVKRGFIGEYIYIYMLTPPPMIHVLVLKRGGGGLRKPLHCTKSSKC